MAGRGLLGEAVAAGPDESQAISSPLKAVPRSSVSFKGLWFVCEGEIGGAEALSPDDGF